MINLKIFFIIIILILNFGGAIILKYESEKIVKKYPWLKVVYMTPPISIIIILSVIICLFFRRLWKITYDYFKT